MQKFISFFLMSSLALAAEASVYECKMNGHIKVDGHPMNITVRLDVGFWGYGSARSGSYSYLIADGRNGKGILICAPKEDGEQNCFPKGQDPVLDRVIITRMMGPIVQVRDQAPIGAMNCEEVKN